LPAGAESCVLAASTGGPTAATDLLWAAVDRFQQCNAGHGKRVADVTEQPGERLTLQRFRRDPAQQLRLHAAAGGGGSLRAARSTATATADRDEDVDEQRDQVVRRSTASVWYGGTKNQFSSASDPIDAASPTHTPPTPAAITTGTRVEQCDAGRVNAPLRAGTSAAGERGQADHANGEAIPGAPSPPSLRRRQRAHMPSYTALAACCAGRCR